MTPGLIGGSGFCLRCGEVPRLTRGTGGPTGRPARPYRRRVMTLECRCRRWEVLLDGTARPVRGRRRER